MQYQRVLVVIDLDEPGEALFRRARALAAHPETTLDLVAALPPRSRFYHDDATDEEDVEREALDRAREHAVGLCCTHGVDPTTLEVLSGPLDRVAVRKADSIGADLIAFPNSTRHGLQRFIGGAELGLLHRTHCDLLAVSERTPDAPHARPLVAINLDGLEQSVLAGIRRLCPADVLDVLHVIRPAYGDYDPYPFLLQSSEHHRDEVKATIEEILDELLDEYAPASLSFATGVPSSRIHQHADENHNDLIALSSGTHHGLSWRLGSTAQTILETSQLDVLIVRPLDPTEAPV